MICGTSIGSLNGALIGSGWNADQLEAGWYNLNNRGIFNISVVRRLKYQIKKLFRRNPEWPGYLSNEPLRQLLLESIDVARLRDDNPNVVVAATNIRRAKLEYFVGEELTIDHILASCSIPVLFPWVEIAGEQYWDGGIMANTPILPALDAGAVEIIVVLLAPLAGSVMELPNSTAVRLFGVVAPQSMSGVQTMLDLDRESVKRRVAEGYGDAVAQLSGFMDRSLQS